MEVLRGAAAGRSPDYLGAVTDTDTVAQLIRLSHRVFVADPLYTYAVRLAAATREHKQVRVGVSPRGVIALTPGRPGVRAHRRPGVRRARGRQGAHRAGLRAPAAARPGRRDARRHAGRGAAHRRSSRCAAPSPAASPGLTVRLTARGYGLLVAGVAAAGAPASASATRSWPRSAAPASSRWPARSAFVAWRPRLTVDRAVDPDRVTRGEPSQVTLEHRQRQPVLRRQPRRPRPVCARAAACRYRWSGCGPAG